MLNLIQNISTMILSAIDELNDGLDVYLACGQSRTRCGQNKDKSNEFSLVQMELLQKICPVFIRPLYGLFKSLIDRQCKTWS